MSPKVTAAIHTASEMGWQYRGDLSYRGHYVWEKPDGALVTYPTSGEPEITMIQIEKEKP